MININRLYNSKLYQLLKFFHNGKIPREIIFVFANCNQISADYVLRNVEFCNNLLDYLPEEKGEYLQTRIIFYKYYNNSHSQVGNWSSNKNVIKQNLGQIKHEGNGTGGCYQGQVFKNIYDSQKNNFQKESQPYMIVFPHVYCAGTGCNLPINEIKFNINMFFIINNWGSTIYNASLCFHCIPDNVIIYTKEEIPMIFPDNSKPIGALDKEITISCKRRKYKSAEFFIQSDKEFKNFEIELYLSSESKPVQKFFYDRQKLIISDLMENQCYLIRVRGVDIESNIYTKWSKETSFYPLKGSELNNFFCDKNKMNDFIEEQKEKINKFVIDLALQIFGLKRFNFLAFGAPAAGKSSALNTFLSILRNEYICKASTSSSQKSYTQTLTQYCLNATKTLYFWDIFGFSGENFKNIMDLLLSGQLKDGYKQGESLGNNAINNKPTINDQVHAVVFFMDSTNLELEIKEYINHIKTVQKAGYQPIIILTKIDEYYKKKLGILKMELPTSNLFIDGFAEEAIEEFMESSDNVLPSKNFVFPAVNYTGPYMEVDAALELLTIFNFLKILKIATNYLTNKFENSVLIYNKNNEHIGYISISSLDSTLSQNRAQLRNMLLEALNIKNDRINYQFMNLNKQIISNEKENEIRLRDIVFSDDNVVNSKYNAAIRLNFNDIDEKPEPIIIIKEEQPIKPPNTKNINPNKNDKSTPDSKIFIDVFIVKENNQKENKASIYIEYSSTISQARKEIEINLADNNDTFPFSFIDKSSKIISDNLEKDLVVKDIMFENILLIKPLVYSLITIRNKKNEDIGYSTNVSMNINVANFREILNNDPECSSISKRKIYKNKVATIPLGPNLERQIGLDSILMLDEKDGYIIWME